MYNVICDLGQIFSLPFRPGQSAQALGTRNSGYWAEVSRVMLENVCKSRIMKKEISL